MSIHDDIMSLKSHIKRYIIGQHILVDRLLIALLSDGHLLIEGMPGLAKTRAIKVLADGIEGDFHRVQFTPDLLPADLTGTEIYWQQEAKFIFQKGPLFHNIVLADEINRAPAKVQSALLEAMAERQITVGQQTYKLPRLFMVMATQNSIDQEGTYPLPEAQLDRFIMHVKIEYPQYKEEQAILHLDRLETRSPGEPQEQTPLSQEILFKARRAVQDVYMVDKLEEYLLNLIMATRNPGAYGDKMAGWLQYGASPRATIMMDRCARAHAWLAGRDYVTPEDIHAIVHDVLRHRIIPTYEAEAEGITTEMIINEIITSVALP